MRASQRIAGGLLLDRGRPVSFRFDGRAMQGVCGDTLASALLAVGERLIGRSFKYHRPRGIVTAGPEEPCALVDVLGAAGREPNRLATTLELSEGLSAESQNRWPSLRFDVMAMSGRLARFLPAGFYYKTFMTPSWAWERLYEPLIRRAAGLGRLEAIVGTHAQPAETEHDHADVLVIGAGTAGLAAAHALSRMGVRVIVVEQGAVLGGGALLDPRWDSWRESIGVALRLRGRVRCLTRTCVIGAYGQGVFAALETLSSEESTRCRGLRERLHVIRAQRVIVASGAVERLIAFPGNDVPGVMLAGAALSYLRLYGVAVGRRPAFFVNSDAAYEAVFALQEAGIECAAVIDVRGQSRAADRARALGIPVHAAALVDSVVGGRSVRALRVIDADGGRPRDIEADSLMMSGGYSPATALASQLGANLAWQPSIAAFTAELPTPIGRVAGGARGVFGLAAAARDGEVAGLAIAAELRATVDESSGANATLPLPTDPEATAMASCWEVRGRGKAFVDLQNDVTGDDVRLAQREGYEHVEHMKRYTTHSMATDQGRIGGLVGSAILAAARGVSVAEVGQPRPRPYLEPTPFAALAGSDVRAHFKPVRRLPLHEWHRLAGATFVATGLWLRPLVYGRDTGWGAVLEEARAVRRSVGMTDVSTLGKIDVQGPDAAQFLDLIYANTFSTLAVGRARYGIMLREDGMMLDDGTTSRLAADHFVVTTTTVNSAVVLEHMESHLQAVWQSLDVTLTDIGDHWAQFAIAGPRSREVVAAIVPGLDLSNGAFPFMAVAQSPIAGVAGRVFRISFSGELAYEIAVPARHAREVWSAAFEAGRSFGIRPYGLDALNTLRIEKGHVTGAELNGNTTADDLGFARMLKKRGDFIGRVLVGRPGLVAGDRLQLIGVRPIDRSRRLRNGAQFVEHSESAASLGYVTSCTPSVEGGGWVGLGLLAGGRQRIGQRLIVCSPIHRETIEVEIVSPHMLDPENQRVRA